MQQNKIRLEIIVAIVVLAEVLISTAGSSSYNSNFANAQGSASSQQQQESAKL